MPQLVHCTNCGTPWWQAVISITALVIAVVAAVAAYYSMRYARTQTRHLIEELARKPQFDIRIHAKVDDKDCGTAVELPAVGMIQDVMLWIELYNSGQASLRDALINVWLPADLGAARIGRDDAPTGDIAREAQTPLADEDGDPLHTVYFHWTEADSVLPETTKAYRFALRVASEGTIPVKVGVYGESASWIMTESIAVTCPTGS